jgi:hypothetical protein
MIAVLSCRTNEWQARGASDSVLGRHRTYMVDNTGLMPNAFPDHFFVTGGPGIWAAMTQNEYIAARSLRLVEEAINAQPASSRSKLVDIKSCVTSPIHRGRSKPCRAHLRGRPCGIRRCGKRRRQAHCVVRTRGILKAVPGYF